MSLNKKLKEGHFNHMKIFSLLLHVIKQHSKLYYLSPFAFLFLFLFLFFHFLSVLIVKSKIGTVGPLNMKVRKLIESFFKTSRESGTSTNERDWLGSHLLSIFLFGFNPMNKAAYQLPQSNDWDQISHLMINMMDGFWIEWESGPPSAITMRAINALTTLISSPTKKFGGNDIPGNHDIAPHLKRNIKKKSPTHV